MRSTFLLIGVWVLGSGVVAYVGDYLGRRMGKRRMTLWGLRPRHTAILFTVVTGMAISALTLAAVARLDENVRTALFSVEHLRATQRRLERESSRLRSERAQLVSSRDAAMREATAAARQTARARQTAEVARRQAEAAQRQASEARRQSAELEKEVQARRRDLALARGSLAKLSQHLAASRQQLRLTRSETNQVKGELDRQRQLLARLKEGTAEAIGKTLGTEPTFRIAEEIYRGAIYRPGSVPSVRKELERMLRAASELAVSRGAAARGSRAVVLVPHRLTYEDAKTHKAAQVIVNEEQQLASLAAEISRSQSDVVIRLVAAMNCLPKEPVLARLEVYPNRRVFRRGDTIASDLVDGQQSDARILESVLRLLQVTVREQALESGMLPSPTGEVGQADWEQILAAVQKLRERKALVTVHARAASDVWTGDPLRVRLTVADEA